ncbi:MAG TPA: type II toxin-antitoxin system VapC family toxin [Thermoanaerobaculia bacterium]|nr:type II toxin-antitoxin system VapC family toxin [Thermoanaerobaculia bacterium]
MSPADVGYLVVDASVSLKWALNDEEDVERALALRDDGVDGRFQMIAPSLWWYEIANGVVSATRRRRLSDAEGAKVLASLRALGVGIADPDIEDCRRLAVEYRLAVYDASYLALALALEVDLWTADRKFFEAVKPKLRFVRWIGDYRSA